MPFASAAAAGETPCRRPITEDAPVPPSAEAVAARRCPRRVRVPRSRRRACRAGAASRPRRCRTAGPRSGAPRRHAAIVSETAHRAAPRRLEHGGVARRIDDRVDQVRARAREHAIERRVELVRALDPTCGDAHRQGDGGEIGVAVAHGSLASVPLRRLLDPDQAERAVIEDDDRDVEREPRERLELGEGHADAAVADEADDAASRPSQGCRDRGREGEPHRREPARDQRLARPVDHPERHRDEHVRTGVDGRDRPGRCARPHRIHDLVRGHARGSHAHPVVAREARDARLRRRPGGPEVTGDKRQQLLERPHELDLGHEVVVVARPLVERQHRCLVGPGAGISSTASRPIATIRSASRSTSASIVAPVSRPAATAARSETMPFALYVVEHRPPRGLEQLAEEGAGAARADADCEDGAFAPCEQGRGSCDVTARRLGDDRRDRRTRRIGDEREVHGALGRTHGRRDRRRDASRARRCRRSRSTS